MKYTKLFYSISRAVVELLRSNSGREDDADTYKKRENLREIQVSLWLLIIRIIFLTREKTSLSILIG